MKNKNEKFGIIISVIVTGVTLGMVSGLGSISEGSIQSQGQELIKDTTNEIETIPETVGEVASNTLEDSYEIVSEIPEETNQIIEESDSVPDIIEKSSDVIEDILPEVPKVIQQTDGDLIEMISIPRNTGVPGCEKNNNCFIPTDTKIQPNGDVIWTNNDEVAHTVTSGNPRDGPNGLFDSGLIAPGETYSLQFDIPFEYDYFCIVHPWMAGTITVE